MGVNRISQNIKTVLNHPTEELLEGETQMDWITIYITGEKGFKSEVAKRLDHSELDYMPGYIGNAAESTDHDMYWVDKNLAIRDFKEAIGAKAIWKYRIRVYRTLEEFIASQNIENNSFTDNDNALIQEMRKAPFTRRAS